MRTAALLWLGLFVAAVAGCAGGRRPSESGQTIARFFLESGGDAGLPVTLPLSGLKLAVNATPVITEGDIVNVELVQVDLGKCLLFQLTPAATRDFYRLSGTHQGRRLVLMLNGVATGARRLDGVITDGVIYIFLETPEAELPRLVENLKRTSAAVQREVRRK